MFIDIVQRNIKNMIQENIYTYKVMGNIKMTAFGVIRILSYDKINFCEIAVMSLKCMDTSCMKKLTLP